MKLFSGMRNFSSCADDAAIARTAIMLLLVTLFCAAPINAAQVSTPTDTAARPVYRTITRTFHTDSYYTKGLLESEVTWGGKEGAKKYLQTVNSYEPRVEAAPELPSVDLTNARIFPQLVRTERKFFEGGAGEKHTDQSFEYDSFGNVTHFTDNGDEADDDTVEAQISYTTHCSDSYIVGKPKTIRVYSGNNEWRLREGKTDCTTGDFTELQQRIGNGESAQTNLSYDDHGNLKSVEGPANLNNERYTLSYDYDTQVATHVVKVHNSFGYESKADYNLHYGKPKSTADLNGNVISYSYDNFGRTVAIQGPYEQGGGNDTLHFTYRHDVPTPYALTSHLNVDAAGNKKAPINTVLFTDGLKRVLQTKKSAAVNGTSMMIVSGRVVFDGLGRTLEQYYPVTEETTRSTTFNTDVSEKYHTATEYDVLDRTVKTTLPDTTVTTMAYGFG